MVWKIIALPDVESDVQNIQDCLQSSFFWSFTSLQQLFIAFCCQFCILVVLVGGWGENGAERRPPPGIQAQRPRTRTARTTRQVARPI